MADFNIPINVPHSLTPKRAALALQAMDLLTLERCSFRLRGTIDTPGPGKIEVVADVDVDGNSVNIVLSGTKPIFVFDDLIEKKVKADIMALLQRA